MAFPLFRPKYLFLVCILIFAFFLRVKDLSKNPPELFSDEITNVLSATRIIETGKDINGRTSFYFYNRVESRSPIYGYLAAASSFVLGQNNFAVRFPAALLGTVSVLLVFLLTKKINGNELVAFFSAAIFAILPWSIHYSRIGWESSIFLPFFLSAILAFLATVRSQKPFFIILSYFLFGIFIYTYRVAELISPLFLVVLLIIYRKVLPQNRRAHLLGILLFLIMLLPLVKAHFSDPLLHGRAGRVFVFSEGINQTSLKSFLNNYKSHFSLNYLFLAGDPNLRHGTGRTGVVYSWMIPFLVFGLIFLLKGISKKENLFLVIWTLLFPIAGSLATDGSPHATRTLLGAPLLAIIAGVGFGWLIKIRPALVTAVGVLVVILGLLEFSRFYKVYYQEYPFYSAGWWEYGTREVFASVKSFENNYQRVCLGNINYWNEETFLNYYLHQSPLEIINNTEDVNCVLPRTLMVLDANYSPPNGFSLIKLIYDPSGQAIWGVYGN